MVLFSIFLLTITVTAVSAKNANADKNPGREASGSAKRISNAVTTLEQMETNVKNPKAKAAIQLAVQTAEQSEATAESSLNEMAGRPGFLKFIIGPDYKNAGQVRSEIVRLRNQISKLTRTRDGLSSSDQAAIDKSISALQTDLTSIETRLNDALKGVSLFGWLSKLLNGFVAPTTVATPTASASATPVSTVSPVPTATAVATEGPVATSTPEIPPTAD